MVYGKHMCIVLCTKSACCSAKLAFCLRQDMRQKVKWQFHCCIVKYSCQLIIQTTEGLPEGLNNWESETLEISTFMDIFNICAQCSDAVLSECGNATTR